MKKENQNKFLKGAIILMLFGLLSKVVGAIYRIPLTGIITAEGMGLYQMVFPLYTLMLTISSSGLPSSISKLISENIAQNHYKQANRILKVSFVLLFCFSVVASLMVFFGAKLFALVQGNKDAYICYLGLSPAIIFVGLISGFRGYFQGKQAMTPSAISGFLEQIFKLIFGLWFASIFTKKGVSYGVLGALLGISVSEIIAFVFLLIAYLRSKKQRGGDEYLLSRKQTAKQILSLSIFVTLGGLIMPLTMLIDSAVTINILKSIGYSVKMATTLFGLQTGSVGSIVNMPVVLSLGVATAILPCVSHQKAQNDTLGVQKSASKALLIGLVLALPASVGCLALAEPILKILYFKSLTYEEIEVSIQILQVASISIFYLALLQISSGLLQGLGLFKVPLISLAVGGVVKVILNIVLIRIKSINILGGEVSNSLCYAVALLINLWVLKKKGVIILDARILVVALLSIFVFASKYVFKALVGLGINLVVSFLIAVVVTIIVYFFFVFLLYRRKRKLL